MPIKTDKNSVQYCFEPVKFIEIPDQVRVSTMYYKCHNDFNWSMNFVSESCAEILECPIEDVLKKEVNLGEMIVQSEANTVWEVVQEALKEKRAFQLIYHIKTPCGNEKILLDQGQGIFTGKENEPEIGGFLTDITSIISINKAPINPMASYFENFKAELAAIVEKMSGQVNVKSRISDREIEIFVRLCQGMTMKEIGIELKISPRTVEMHINRIKFKLMCNTQFELRKLLFMTNSGRQLISII